MMRTFPVVLTMLLTACATRPVPVAVAPPVPIPAPASYAMPAGTYLGMPVPALLADGHYATPNRSLSPAGTVWHLRAGLNFAALGCRGANETAIIAGYNAMLAMQKPVLAAAESRLAAEYRATGGAQWRDAYDDAMTRLYNYYAMSAARPALCATAERLLTEAQTVPAAGFADFAAQRLPDLDRAFTDVFAAYDAWRTQAPRVSYAAVANTAVGQAPQAPWIDVDPAVLRMP